MNESALDALMARLRRGRMGRRAAFALGLAAPLLPAVTRGRRRQKRPLRRNAFGCVPVGKPCRGKDGVCCSGVCRGRRPKPGKRDRSRCLAHDADVCRAGQQTTTCGAGPTQVCTTTGGSPGVCETTTGNGGYCSSAVAFCMSCGRDAECQAAFSSPRAACVRCAGCAGGVACVFP